ncbi:phage tail tape measure protein [Deinococcus hohokamensis]|uniref:Phage tail tape measure protein n=1 Tax=Deinococcus hohokamensis TaxID=309883 RepID=A0ABV9I5G9_9DEIO
MSELRDNWHLDHSQPLKAIEEVEARIERLFRQREVPLLKFKLPPAPAEGQDSGSRPQRRATESQIDRLTNRLRVVQQELKRLGNDATPEQLRALDTRLGRLSAQAELLAPGLDKGSNAARRLGNVLTGLVGTSADVRTAMDRLGEPGTLARRTQAMDAQIKSLGKSIGTVNDLWRLQILTDGQAGQSAQRLRDQLLKLASAEGTSADAALKAVQTSVQAQRLLDNTRGEAAKGGFAYNASLGILDALSRTGGPVGAAAFGLGTLVNSGLLAGFIAGKPRVGKGAQDMGEEVINSLKTKLQIRSPSRVTTVFGLNVAESLALGMKSGMSQVAKAGTGLGNAAQSGVNRGLQSLYGPKLQQSLKLSGGAFGGVADQARNGTTQLGKYALSAEQIGFVAGTAAVAITAFGAAMASAVNSGARFEEQLVNIKALTQPTAAELVQLKDAAMNLGTDLGVGPTETAKAILELNKAGLSAAEAVGGGLAGALNLAGAAGIEAGQGANIAVSAMTAFGLTAKDLPAVADVFANFANKTTLGAEDLSQFFASLGPAAKDAGLNIEQVAGYAASLAQGGFKQMSDAGTSFKTFLSSLQAPSDTAKKALKQLDVSFYDTSGAARPLGEVLEEVRSKLANLTDEQRNARIADIFGSDAGRAARVFFSTTNAAIEENIKAMGLQGEAARVARERLSSYAGQVKVLRAEWKNFTAMIGMIFLPMLTSVVKTVRNVVDALGNVLNDSDRIKAFFKELAIVVAGVGLAYIYLRREMITTAALNAYASLPAVWNAVRLGVIGAANAVKLSYLPAMGNAIKASLAFAAANPWLLVIAGATAAALTIQKLYGDISNTYARMDEANQSSFESTMKRVRALQQEGGELNRTKAKLLLALQQQQDAETGTLKGVKLTGERIYEVDDAQVVKARTRVRELREELTRLQTEQGRRDSAPKPKVTNLDPEEVKKQTEALKELRQELSRRALRLRVDGLTELGGQLEQLGDEFDALSIKLKTAFNFDLTNTDLLKGLAELRGQRERETTAAIAAALKDQKQVRLDHEREVQSAEAALIKDAASRRRAEYDQQVRELQDKYSPQIQEALRNSQNKSLSTGDRRRFQEEAGLLQVLQNREAVALARQRDQDLDQIAKERLDKERDLQAKIRAAQQQTLDAQANATSAAVKLLEGQRDRELAIAGDVPAARLAIEQRYAGQLQKLQQEQLAISGQAQRAALQATYQQQLRDAEDAGARRGELERNAREQLLLGLQSLELEQQAETAAAQLAQEERLQKERTAIYQQQLDRRMDRAKDATAQELRGLERVLQAERARAVAAGDGGKVAAIDQALGSIADIKADNVRAFREELSGAERTAADLQKRLADIDQTPLGQARSSAAQPFNEIVKGADQQLRDLRDKLRKADLTPELRDRYQRDEAELTRIRSVAAQQRGVAILGAEQAFERELQDRAQASALKLAKTEYDTSHVAGAYLDRLKQDRAYWEARLLIAKSKHNEELQVTAEQHLADNDGERDRVLQEQEARRQEVQKRTLDLEKLLSEESGGRSTAAYRAALIRARDDIRAHLAQLKQGTAEYLAARQQLKETEDALFNLGENRFSLEQGQRDLEQHRLETSLQLATSEGQRTAARAQLVNLADRDLVAAQAHLAVLNGTAQAEQLSTQMRAKRLEIDQAAAALEEARRGGVASEIETAQARLTALQAQYDRLAGTKIDVATPEQIAQGEERVLAASTRTQQVRQAQIQAADDLLASQLKLQSAEDGYAAAVARSNQAILVAKQSALATSQDELAALDGQIASARQRGLTEAQVNDLLAQRLQKITGIYDQQRGIRQFVMALDQQAFEYNEAVLGLEVQRASTGQDSLRSQVTALATTGRQIVQLERQLALADANLLTEQERLDLQTKRVNLLTQDALQVQALNDARRQAAQQSADLFRPKLDEVRKSFLGDAQVEVERLSGFVRDTEADLAGLRQELSLLEKAGEPTFEVSRGIALAEGTLAEAQLKLNTARKAAADLNHALVQAEQDLHVQLARGTETTRSMVTASTTLTGSREALAQAEREYAAAQRGESKERLKSATEGLIKAISDERSAVSNLQGEYGKLVSQMDGVQDATSRLKDALRGDQKDNGPINGSREIDRFMAIQRRRDAALRAAQDAVGGGDPAEIQKSVAALADQEKRLRDQQALLRKNGISVSLSGTQAVEKLLNDVDKLGIDYDAQAAAAQERVSLLEREEDLLRQGLDGRHDQLEQEAGLLSERARLADQELEAARQYVVTGQQLSDAASTLRAAVQAAGSYLVTSAPARPVAPSPQQVTDVAAAAAAATHRRGDVEKSAPRVGPQPPSSMTKTVTITNHISIPVTVDGQPVPTPQEFRQIAHEVVGEVIGGAQRAKAWEDNC